MGLCASKSGEGGGKVDKNADAVDKEIHRQMVKDDNQARKVFKLLLLGAGESGKSTLFKQMNNIYGKGFSDDDKRGYVGHIRNNVMLCLRALADNCKSFGELLPENEAICTMLCNNEEIDSSTVEEALVNQYKSFWQDPTVQLAWEHRAEFQIYGCAAYFLDKLDELVSSSYLPTEQDILQTRVRTTGIVENQFVIDGNKFSLYDVGGQRNERKKWIHCFENVTAVIFVAAISEYDQRLFEDENTNRLDEALTLFSEIANSRWFKETSLLLFLNKRDLFEEKIKRVPFTNFFPHCDAPDTYEGLTGWIEKEFKSRNKHGDKVVYCHITCATDTSNTRHIFNSVTDIIIRSALQGLGIN